MANYIVDRIIDAAPGAAPFLIAPSGDVLTYDAMRERSAKAASALVALGVKPGDRVAVQIEKSAEGLAVYLGALRAGAIFLPLNTAYTPAELDYFLKDAEPTVFICDPGQHAAIVGIAGNCLVETLDSSGCGSFADKIDAASPMPKPVPRGPDDLAAILYTSGTTGRSKGAMLSHANLASNAEALAEAWHYTASDRLLHALPVYHTHGLFVACNITMVAGASMIFMPKLDPAAMIAAMPSATVMMGVPTFYTRLLDQADFTREVASGMRLFVSGSAPLLAETHRAWLERTGHAILERYGMTETNMNCSNPYEGERRPGTVGFPLPGVEARVVDPDDGTPLGVDKVGMIEVRGPNVFKGYWRNPEKTASEFRADGFFVTGDLGKIDPDGYVHIVGRGKDLVISGGFNVYPKEVELEIDAIAGVVESAVIGLPHRDFGEGVTAIVVKTPDAPLDEAAVKKSLEGRLAKFKLPKRVLFADELPRNTMGKVQKNVLREKYKNLFE